MESNVFAGGAFHPSLNKGKSSGEISIGFEGITFRKDASNVLLPLDRLEVSLGGASDRIVFFKHPDIPDWTVFTSDLTVVQHPILVRDPRLGAQISQVKKRRLVGWGVSAAILLTIIVGLAGLYVTRDRITHSLAEKIPADWEVTLGEKVFDNAVSGKNVLEDADLLDQLEMLTGPLLVGIGDLEYDLHFHIIEDSSVNAFAIPGGNVVLHTGLLLAAEGPEEVAGVLAHEIAHVTERHGFRNIIGSAGLFMVVQLMIGDASGVLAVIADNSAFLMNKKFSRDFEREADDKGWDYLVQAGIHPEGMVGFFRKMKEEEERIAEESPLGEIGEVMSLLSTHPATDERIAHLEGKLEEGNYSKSRAVFTLNYDAFKDSIREHLHRQQ